MVRLLNESVLLVGKDRRLDLACSTRPVSFCGSLTDAVGAGIVNTWGVRHVVSEVAG